MPLFKCLQYLLIGTLFYSTISADLETVDQNNQTSVLEMDRMADSSVLVTLYRELDGANWTNPWTLTQPITEWDGVSVNQGRVIGLFLDERGLKGEIPVEIGDLPNLEYLNLFENDLIGMIPESVGNLTKLKGLALYNNNLSGALPQSIGQLKDLEELSLSNNQITGPFPDDFGTLTNLKNVYLSNNPLNCPLPNDVGGLSALEGFFATECQLTGSIPTSIGDLKNLKSLYLSTNNLVGDLPTNFGDATGLEIIALVENNLTGSVPASFSRLSRLKELYLRANSFTNFDADFSGLTQLSLLELSNNSFINLPDGLSEIVSLNTVLADDNRLTFEDLLPVRENPGVSSFTYIPQQFISFSADTTVFRGNDVLLSLPFDQNVLGNNVTWYKDGRYYTLISNSSSLSLTEVELTDAGSYSVQVSNPSFPGLIINAGFFQLGVESTCSRSEDSTLLASLFVEMNRIQEWDRPWELDQPLDTWHGVGLDDFGCVASINLSDNNFGHFFPLQFLELEGLRSLDLSNNNITGCLPIDSLFWCQQLEVANISGNDGLHYQNSTEICQPDNQLKCTPISSFYTGSDVDSILENKTLFEDLVSPEYQVKGCINSTEISDEIQIEDCGSQVIVRTYTLFDDEGELLSSCMHQIGILPFTTDNVEFPSNINFTCNQDILLNSNGFPLPEESGFPTLTGSFGGVTPLNESQNGYTINYEDSNPQFDEDLITFDRIWRIRDECGDQEINKTQKISYCPPCSVRDSVVLIDLYDNLGGNGWSYDETTYQSRTSTTANIPNAIEPWNRNTAYSNWHGIEVDNEGCVTRLILPGNNLNGTLPPSFLRLSEIREIDLERNLIRGIIPNGLGNLTFLESIDLENNSLEGDLPTGLGGLIYLKEIDFSRNNLSGCFPEEYSKFCNITSDFRTNPLLPWEGELKTTFCLELEQIGAPCDDGKVETEHDEILEDCTCGFRIKVDTNSCRYQDSIRLLQFYEEFSGDDWSNNENWESNLPLNDWYGIRTNEEGCVVDINLRNNGISGDLSAIANLQFSSVVSLNLNENNLEGSIPELTGFPELTTLSLNNNKISRGILTLSQIPKLEIVDLSYNQVNELIPNFNSNPSLRRINISGNQLTFEDIRPNIRDIRTLIDKNRQSSGDTYIYSPQDSVYQDTTITLVLGEDYTIDLNFDLSESSNSYIWKKNGNSFRIVNQVPRLYLSSVDENDQGQYSCIISNSLVPGLTLYSRKINIEVVCPQIPNVTTNIQDSTCTGSEYLFGVRSLTQPGIYYDTTQAQNGCDSITILNLKINSDIEEIVDSIICPGDLPPEPTISITPDGCQLTTRYNPIYLNETPDAGIDQTVCVPQTQLNANLPINQDVIGRWESNTGLTDFANDPKTFAFDLGRGNNIFYWILNHPICGDFDTSQVQITYNPNVSLHEEDQVFTFDVAPSERVEGKLSLPPNFQEQLTIKLEESDIPDLILEESGKFSFTSPVQRPFQHSFTYNIFLNECPDITDKVNVTIYFLPLERRNPITLTPDGDGINDFFLVPELEDGSITSADNELVVFNRWGKVVFHDNNYQNNFYGRHQDTGKLLPSGPYFYVLTLDNLREKRYGELTILRR